MIVIDTGPSRRGWHFYESILRCPQLWAQHYGNGPGVESLNAPMKAVALSIGGLVHVGSSHAYARIGASQGGVRVGETFVTDPGDIMEPLAAVATVARRSGAPDSDREEALATVQALLQDTFLDDARQWRVVGVEVPVERRIPCVDDGSPWWGKSVRWDEADRRWRVVDVRAEGHLLTQRIDLLVRDPAGALLGVDHKTTAKLGKGSVARYTLSGQFAALRLFTEDIAARKGIPFGGVLVNVIGVRGSRGKALRRALPVSLAAQALPATIRYAEAELVRLVASELPMAEWPKRLSELVCMTPYGRCSGWAVCRGIASPWAMDAHGMSVVWDADAEGEGEGEGDADDGA